MLNVNQILSAEYGPNGQLIFKVDADINSENFPELIHSYKPSSRKDIDLLCAAWLETNTPTAYSDPVMTDAQLEAEIRAERNALIAATTWILERHRAEVDNTAITTTSLTDAEYQAWLTYHQELRDITEQVGFPTSVVWPTRPTL